MSTLLNYALTTEPFPLLASPATGPTNTAKLTVIASNPTPEVPVVIKKVTITLPIGAKASDLTADVPASAVPPQYWKFTGKTLGEGSVDYHFAPEVGHKEVRDQGLDFVFNAIVINRQPGISRVEIAEVSSDENLTLLSIAKFPHGWGEVAFAVDPANIQAGESTTLDWAGPSGATYSIEYYMPEKGIVNVPKPGEDPLKNVGTYPGEGQPKLTLEVNTDFTLHIRMNISGRIYHSEVQRRVTVIPRPPVPPSITYFRPRGCTDSDCVVYGEEFILEWDIQNAESNQRQLTQDWKDEKGTPITKVITMPWKDKSILVRPTEKEVRYTLMVKEKNLEVTATVTATIIPPVPVATIVPYGAIRADQLPPGWLYCNGGEYSRSKYPQLYAAIGELYGKAGNADNGKLPDLRGYFVRGYDDGKGVDPGRGIGTMQPDTFKSHTHTQVVTANQNSGGSAVRASFTGDVGGYTVYEQKADTKPTGDSETRPKNMASYFVIYAGTAKPPAVSMDDSKGKKDKSKGKDKSKASKGKSKAKATKDTSKGKMKAAPRGRTRTGARRASR